MVVAEAEKAIVNLAGEKHDDEGTSAGGMIVKLGFASVRRGVYGRRCGRRQQIARSSEGPQGRQCGIGRNLISELGSWRTAERDNMVRVVFG